MIANENNCYLDSTGNSLTATSYESQSYNSSTSYRSKAISLNDKLIDNKPLIDGSNSSTLRLEMSQSPTDLAALSDQSSSWYGVYNAGTLPSNQRMINQTTQINQEYEEISAL